MLDQTELKYQDTTVSLIRGPILSTFGAINNEAVPAIGLAYIAGYIKQSGFNVAFIDAIAMGLNRYTPVEELPGYQTQGMSLDETVESIPEESKVIGVSTMFSGEWPANRVLIQKIRARFPDALIVAGGEHITALYDYSLKDCPEIDVCVLGEGEATFLEVVETWLEGNDLNNVGSIVYKNENNEFVKTGALKRIREVNEIPWPYWPDGYMEQFWEHGKSYGVATERDMPIMASRGCPYQCTFCSNPQMWTTRYILRDIDDLINEIKFYIEKYDITALQFYDLTAITKKKWTIEFCNRLISEGINLKWSLPSGTRSEALDEETLHLMNKTGCNYLVYAPESGSTETLEIIKKRIEKKAFTESVMQARRQGLILRTNLIIGFPHEKRSHIFQTIKYGLYLAIRGVDEVSINIFSPYPGTEIFDELIKNGIVELSDEYFLSLTSLNSNFTALNPMTVNPHVGARELALYRLIFLLMNYGLGYIIYFKRIFRSLKTIFGKEGHTTTVFEHRIRDLLNKK